MKKLTKLTLKNLGDSLELLDTKETMKIKGGTNGSSEYYLIYGSQLPDNVGYDVVKNECYPLTGIPGPYDYDSSFQSSFGNVPGSGSDQSIHMNYCNQCPTLGTGPDDNVSGEGKMGFRIGVYINHYISHGSN